MTVELDGSERMLLDALMKLKKLDDPSHQLPPQLAAKACAGRTR